MAGGYSDDDSYGYYDSYSATDSQSDNSGYFDDIYDDYDSPGATESQSNNNSRAYSDDDSYVDDDSSSATYYQSNNSGEYSDDESYGDRDATYSKSDDSQEYSDDESYGDHGTTYSKSDYSQEHSDDESYDDYGESKAISGEHSDDDSYALGDYNTTYTGSKATGGGNQVSVHQQTYRLKNEHKQSGSYERFTAEDKTVSGEPFVDSSASPISTSNSIFKWQEYDEDYVVDYGTPYSESNTKSEGHSGEKHSALGDYGTSYSKSTTQSGGSQVDVYQKTYRARNEDKQSGSYERFTAKDKAVCGEPFVDRSGKQGYKEEHTKSATYKVGDKSGYTEYHREEKVKHVEFDKSSGSKNKAIGYYPKYNKY
ncbi:hypothetical protein POM88_009693 [Heracleum sosnowskyi]|uniref:Uncharacterized protein n=1 Tax=Heracleum sosnowskyi TaxID=360622 RepID=A0AAD8J8F8_9APIA|nr:hypothetical protein POM88_009693 [Heracleum sosnowskyi]